MPLWRCHKTVSTFPIGLLMGFQLFLRYPAYAIFCTCILTSLPPPPFSEKRLPDPPWLPSRCVPLAGVKILEETLAKRTRGRNLRCCRAFPSRANFGFRRLSSCRATSSRTGVCCNHLRNRSTPRIPAGNRMLEWLALYHVPFSFSTSSALAGMLSPEPSCILPSWWKAILQVPSFGWIMFLALCLRYIYILQ